MWTQHAHGWIVLDPMNAMSPGEIVLLDNPGVDLHHSEQADFWRRVVETAVRKDLRVVATTHSWDVIAAFVKAAEDLPDGDAWYMRLEGPGERLHVVDYSMDDMKIAVEQDIEVR